MHVVNRRGITVHESCVSSFCGYTHACVRRPDGPVCDLGPRGSLPFALPDDSHAASPSAVDSPGADSLSHGPHSAPQRLPLVPLVESDTGSDGNSSSVGGDGSGTAGGSNSELGAGGGKSNSNNKFNTSSNCNHSISTSTSGSGSGSGGSDGDGGSGDSNGGNKEAGTGSNSGIMGDSGSEHKPHGGGEPAGRGGGGGVGVGGGGGGVGISKGVSGGDTAISHSGSGGSLESGCSAVLRGLRAAAADPGETADGPAIPRPAPGTHHAHQHQLLPGSAAVGGVRATDKVY